LENLDDDVDINRAWKTCRENIQISGKENIGYYKLKPWFDQRCSKLVDQRKQARLQWLQDPGQINGHNFNNVRFDANRHFRNKKKEYLKEEIRDLH
jgi:hypothetical protein